METTAVVEPVAGDAGQRLRWALDALRGVRHMSVARLARELQMSEGALHDRLKGRARLGVEEVEAMAGILGVSFLELVALAYSDDLPAPGAMINTRWYSHDPDRPILAYTSDEPRLPLKWPTPEADQKNAKNALTVVT